MYFKHLTHWASVISMLLLLACPAMAQEGHGHQEGQAQEAGAHGSEAGEGNGGGGKYDAVGTVMHHIGNANEFHLFGHVAVPLPCILYAPEKGWTTCMSSKFEHGHKAFEGYVLDHGVVRHIPDPNFPQELVDVEVIHHEELDAKGKKMEVPYAIYNGQEYRADKASTLDGGMLGGGITSFYDFSISKNVFTMALGVLVLFLIFLNVSAAYKKRKGQAPKGLQGLIEPVFLFIQEEVSKPMIGEKHYERFQPYIMSLFFFILACNLLGLIPFFPGSGNVTGNLAVTMTLALFTFLVTNLNGNAHYWEHILWMPGVPAWVKIILTPVELLGVFIKPFSLMIRLFANISAGHIIILSLIGLIFIFGNNGQSTGGSVLGIIVGGAFTMFMNLIELLVAFLQAFVFSILTASYIGAAVEDHHHAEHAEHH